MRLRASHVSGLFARHTNASPAVCKLVNMPMEAGKNVDAAELNRTVDLTVRRDPCNAPFCDADSGEKGTRT